MEQGILTILLITSNKFMEKLKTNCTSDLNKIYNIFGFGDRKNGSTCSFIDVTLDASIWTKYTYICIICSVLGLPASKLQNTEDLRQVPEKDL